jgi:hypothetical protein
MSIHYAFRAKIKLNSQRNLQTPDLNFSGTLLQKRGKGEEPKRAVQEWP